MNYNILETNTNQWRKILCLIKHDIYHLPEYVALEAKRTNSIPRAFLAIDNNKIFFVPYLIRSCHNIVNKFRKESITEQESSEFQTEILDVVSPYGYPGILLNEAANQDSDFCILALEKFCNCLKRQNICSGFFRLHPILNKNLKYIFPPNILFENGTTLSIDLTRSREKIWQDTKSNHRQKIRRCKKNGLAANITKFSQSIDIFCQLYQETMARVRAEDIYYSFNKEYFQYLDSVMSDHLYLCLVKSASGAPAAAGLYTEFGGIVQAAFCATSNDFVKQSPSFLQIDTMRWWAKEQGYKYLHLGGGVGCSNDGVYQFKAGFSNLKNSFYTLRLIIDQDKYDYLINLKAQSNKITVAKLKDSNFFPTYFAPVAFNSN